MKLTIVTINYNSSENTISLLESLRNQRDKDFDVIVVDNASDKDEFDRLNIYYAIDFTPTKNILRKNILIKNKDNLGFSGGNNVGIKKALENGSDWVFLLNNDTMPERHLIERLRPILELSVDSEEEPKEGIIGLALDEGNQTAFAGRIEWLKPTLEHIHKQTNINSSPAYAIGGAMLIHKSVFDKIGFLDENYFLYFEDADFRQKAKRAGVPRYFLPKIIIPHSVSASAKKLGSPLILRYHYRNALYFNLKNGPFPVRILARPWSWLIMIKQIIKIIVGKNREESVAILRGVIDWYTGKMGKIHD